MESSPSSDRCLVRNKKQQLQNKDTGQNVYNSDLQLSSASTLNYEILSNLSELRFEKKTSKVLTDLAS